MNVMLQKKYFRDQAIALVLTALTCLVLIGFLWGEVSILNHFIREKILLKIRLGDVLLGLTIYLKTSIDFAIFIGNLMAKNTGLKGRIGIEVGTAVGNGVGTMAVLLVWSVFRQVNWLLAIMILIAALVLIKLAQDTLEHANHQERDDWYGKSLRALEKFLDKLNGWTDPVLSKIVPSGSMKVGKVTSFTSLLMVAFTIPFILGLDDFAGYVPLFSIVNVFGFAIGVMLGHMVLNIALYISPGRTVKLVKNSAISAIGSIAFVLLAAWGIIESFKLLFLHH